MIKEYLDSIFGVNPPSMKRRITIAVGVFGVAVIINGILAVINAMAASQISVLGLTLFPRKSEALYKLVNWLTVALFFSLVYYVIYPAFKNRENF